MWFFKKKEVEEQVLPEFEVVKSDPRDLRTSNPNLMIEKLSNQILSGSDVNSEVSKVVYVYPKQWYEIQSKLDLKNRRLGNWPALYWWLHNCYIVMIEDPDLTEKMQKNDQTD